MIKLILKMVILVPIVVVLAAFTSLGIYLAYMNPSVGILMLLTILVAMGLAGLLLTPKYEGDAQ